MWPDRVQADGSAKTFNLATSATTTSAIGGQWSKARVASCWDARSLEQVFLKHGGVPGNIEIASWLEGVSAGNNYKFRVDAFCGIDSDVDRVCLVSATCGTQKLFTRPPLPGANAGDAVATVNSAFFADTFVETENYNHTFVKLDAAGDNGKAKLHGDALGQAFLAINLVSTIPNGGKAGFAIRGW